MYGDIITGEKNDRKKENLNRYLLYQHYALKSAAANFLLFFLMSGNFAATGGNGKKNQIFNTIYLSFPGGKDRYIVLKTVCLT